MSQRTSVDQLSFYVNGSHTQNATISSAVTITAPAGATLMIVQAIDTNIRLTLDGTVPTTTKGFRLTAGRDPIILSVTPGQLIKVIEETATATIEYQFGNA